MWYCSLRLQYLMRALALEEETGHVQNSSSTHLNICAAYSSLKKYREVGCSSAHAFLAFAQLKTYAKSDKVPPAQAFFVVLALPCRLCHTREYQ